MSQIFNILDDKVVISKLALTYLEGTVIHAGSLDIVGNTSIRSNLTVAGTITADTINVKHIVTENGSATPGEWTVNTEAELNGKGFSWTYGDGSTQLIYRTGNRLWCNSDIDLSADSSYKIDNTEVISANALGSSIISSNLRSVGSLNSLTVLGDTNIGEFAFFNTVYNRLGIGTDEPNSSISIIDNNVEISIGSPKYGLANIGTYSNHDVAIITDNTARITIKNNGEVQIGDEINKSATLRVFGSIVADNIVTDTRVERSSPLEFKAAVDGSIYGKGLIWTGSGYTRQLVMMPEPDRLWTSESLDIGIDQAYMVNGVAVLNNSTLGQSVLHSSLTSVGILESLTVANHTTLSSVTSSLMTTDLLQINSTISSNTTITISVQDSDVFYADSSQVVIGNKQNTRIPVKVFGPMSIGINNPDPTVGLSVSGDVSFANKKFINSTSIPTTGTYVKGDICWNQNPTENSYIGWVCILDGTPGEWLPFGAISRQ